MAPKFLNQSNLRILVITIISFALLINPGHSARILFFMGLASHSHRVAIQPLVTALAERGHDVNFFSMVKPEVPNPKVKEVTFDSIRKLFENQGNDLAKTAVLGRLRNKYSDISVEPIQFDINIDAMKLIAGNEDFAGWIKNEKFDLIIYDNPMGQFVYGVAHEMNANIIAFVTPATQMFGDSIFFGLPEEYSWHPTWSPGSPHNWFIPDHFIAAYHNILWYFKQKWDLFPKLDKLLEEFYGKKLPPIEKLISGVDLVLLNEHFSSGYAKALPPYAVPVGGMHVKESGGKLPENVRNFLNTKDRFVYVSFGSILKVSDLPESVQKILFDSVASFEDTNFLWKWEGEIPTNLPKNVFAMQWFPQQDVLAHHKCKGYVMQGGVISYQQAVYHGVPVIVIPVWGDQGYVARTAVFHEIGIHLELSEITNETFSRTLRELLDNEKYLKNVQEMSRRTKDRPMSSVDTAVWWTEYVLRHDTSHLKSPGMQQSWWQRQLLDFWFTVFLTCTLCLFLTHKLIYFSNLY